MGEMDQVLDVVVIFLGTVLPVMMRERCSVGGASNVMSVVMICGYSVGFGGDDRPGLAIVVMLPGPACVAAGGRGVVVLGGYCWV